MGENTIGAAQAAVPNTLPAEGNPTGAPAGEGEKKRTPKKRSSSFLQQEADRRVNEAMQRAKRQKEAAVKEAEKLAAMSAEQKAQYQLEQKERELAEREERLAVAENTAEALKVLADKGIRPGLVKFVVAADAETMMDNINELEKEFKASVKAEVEKRLAGSTPAGTCLPIRPSIRRHSGKMTLAEQQELYINNPELYKRLTGS